MAGEAEAAARIASLEAENRSLKAQRDALVLKEKALGGILFLLLFGPRLAHSIRAWFNAATPANPFPREQFADVIAAILARILRVGLISILLAEAVLIWQNFLIREQNQYFREQTAEIRRQIEQQQTLSDITQRATLVRTIYGRLENCAEAERSEDGLCPHKEDIRTRAEAVVAFVEVERRLKRRIDLSGADLSNMFLARIDLSGAKLLDTNFQSANLEAASFEDANLFRASLEEADLFRACLKNSRLWVTNLTKTALQGASLEGAKVTGQNLKRACGDSTTELPSGFKMPPTWPNCGAGPGMEYGLGPHIKADTPVPCS